MLRAALLAFALAFIPESASAQATPGNQLPPGWGFIQTQGWTLRGSAGSSGDGVLYFTMPASQQMHIWARYEWKTVKDGMGSSRELLQVECNTRRTRIVSEQFFGRNNLEDMFFSGDDIQNWISPVPRSLGAIPLQVLCD
jgi:hypothetical protein